MEKKFAFILMGENYEPAHCALFETPNGCTKICTVCDFEAAKALVQTLYQSGYGAIELCGAFGEEKARELIALTKGQLAIGFVTHLGQQDALFERFFS